MKYIFDIDDTILFTSYKDNKKYDLLDYDKKMVEKINKLYYNGHQVILWTGRHWDKLQETKNQIDLIGVRYHTLLMGKPAADYYIDDKALRPQEFNELYES